MNKKLLISLMLGVLLSLTAVFVVLAGITNDIGTLELDPPVGKVNYTAWLNIYGSGFPPPLVHPPEEILTEDGFNPSAGEDGGFTEDYWQLNVGAFSREENSIPVNIQFGGLGDYGGTHWYYKFKWDGVNELTTHTTPVPESTNTGAACPRILPVEVQDTTKIVSFFGEPSKTYQIYRSTIPACEGCSNSNGRYLHLGEVTTDPNGSGIYQDIEPGITEIQSWYVVIYFDENPYEAHGCHSEPIDPTNVVMGEFTVIYDAKESAVMLAWETLSEINIVGFNVFRGSSDAIVDSVKINSEIIFAKQPGSPVGDIYTFEDDAVEAGQTYYYWIEILTNNMSNQTVGPELVTIPEPTWFYYFLPLLFN